MSETRSNVLNGSSRWVVCKFGGTSVGNPANWPTILDAAKSCQDDDAQPFLVCSALSGISNLLERLMVAVESGGDAEPHVEEFRQRHLEFGAALDLDVEASVDRYCQRLYGFIRRTNHLAQIPPIVRAEIMAVGEILSSRIGADWLRRQGVNAVWKDARDMLSARPALAGACDHQRYLSVVCEYGRDAELLDMLDGLPDDAVVVTQGFIARDAEGRTTLLGRGGSDTAAAYFAAKLAAQRLEIWTDVPGVFTANPQHIPQARLLHTLSYDEAETLAGMGAKVLHPRCIEPVREAEIPLHIRWTARPEVQGTVIEHAEVCRDGIKAVSGRDNLCLISMEKRAGWQPVGFMADVSTCFKRHALSIDMLSSSPWTIQATLDLAVGSGVSNSIPRLLEDLDHVCDPTVDYEIASVSLVGHGMRGCLHGLGSLLEHFRERELLMLTHAGNDLTFSFVVPTDEKKLLLETLHRELFEDVALEEPFGPTWQELVGDDASSNGADAAEFAAVGS